MNTRAAALIISVSLAISGALAANRPVCPTGCTYSTIQSAINAASPGDTILIGKGHYFEAITIVGKRLTLQGIDRRTTIIDANGAGTVVTIGEQTTESNSVATLSDLTVTRGFGVNGGGISVLSGGSLVLRHSTVCARRCRRTGCP